MSNIRQGLCRWKMIVRKIVSTWKNISILFKKIRKWSWSDLIVIFISMTSCKFARVIKKKSKLMKISQLGFFFLFVMQSDSINLDFLWRSTCFRSNNKDSRSNCNRNIFFFFCCFIVSFLLTTEKTENSVKDRNNHYVSSIFIFG